MNKFKTILAVGVACVTLLAAAGCSYLLPADFYEEVKESGIEISGKLRLSLRTGDGVEKIGSGEDLPKPIGNAVGMLASLTGKTPVYQAASTENH